MRDNIVFNNVQNDNTYYYSSFDNDPRGRIVASDVCDGICDLIGVPLVWTPPPLDPEYSQGTRSAVTTLTAGPAYFQLKQKWLVDY